MISDHKIKFMTSPKVFMPPNFEDVKVACWFEPVCASVRQSVPLCVRPIVSRATRDRLEPTVVR